MLCLNFGDQAECICCGGSAVYPEGAPFEAPRGSLCPSGPYCSEECWADFQDMVQADRERHESDWCVACSYDNHEHAPGCPG